MFSVVTVSGNRMFSFFHVLHCGLFVYPNGDHFRKYYLFVHFPVSSGRTAGEGRVKRIWVKYDCMFTHFR